MDPERFRSPEDPSLLAGPDVLVHEYNSLADPVGSHMPANGTGAGHRKRKGYPWVIALTTVPGVDAGFPAAKVDPNVLYVADDNILTSAGTAAGIDASLHLWRQEYGAAVASAIARRMVVPPQRDGGQAQFVLTPVSAPAAETLQPVLTWMQEHLHEEMSVASLARRAAMSSRTFARRFRAETGTTPHHWVTAQRLLLAEQLLEESDASIDLVASRTGFGNAATLRHHFAQSRGITPAAYRRTFSHA